MNKTMNVGDEILHLRESSILNYAQFELNKLLSCINRMHRYPHK